MFVYFVKTKAHPQMLKIGKAKDVERRLAELQTGCPYQMELIGKLKCKSEMHANAMERKLHRTFRHLRTRGEWFNYSHRTHLAVQAVLAAPLEGYQEAASAAFKKHTEKWRKNKPLRQADALARQRNNELDREFSNIVGRAYA